MEQLDLEELDETNNLYRKDSNLSMYNQMRLVTQERAKLRNINYEKFSRDRLERIIETKLRTVFIGAISHFEDYFGQIWGHMLDPNSINENQGKWRKVWKGVRKLILDSGNDQLRALLTELDSYDVKWNRYQAVLPISPADHNDRPIVNGKEIYED